MLSCVCVSHTPLHTHTHTQVKVLKQEGARPLGKQEKDVAEAWEASEGAWRCWTILERGGEVQAGELGKSETPVAEGWRKDGMGL